jgi:hypothetical protein
MSKGTEDDFMPADETEHGFLKVCFYGGPKQGKTYTMLRIPTALGKTALIDTERGAEAYKKIFKHNDGTPFMIKETRQIEGVQRGIDQALKLGTEFLIVDQMTSLWELAQDEYIAREHEKGSKIWETIESSGNVPWMGWKHIKKPYKRLLKDLIDCPMHVFFAARLQTQYKQGGGGEPIKTGEKPAAERDTPYEPQIIIKMETVKKKVLAYVEGDRWDKLLGQVFENPDCSMFADILPLLGSSHKPLAREVEDTSTITIEAIPANRNQIIIVRKLMLKGGVNEVEERLKGMTSQQANEWVNAMTRGDYSAFITEGGE